MENVHYFVVVNMNNIPDNVDMEFFRFYIIDIPMFTVCLNYPHHRTHTVIYLHVTSVVSVSV